MAKLLSKANILKAARALMIVGAINWGLVHFVDWNIVGVVSMGYGWLESTLYGAVAAAGIYAAINYKKFM